MGDLICSVKSISKSFGDKKVLTEISFDIKKGEIIGIIGKSGSGKSTLMNIISGITTPNSGTISFSGNTSRKALKELIGYSFQPYSLYEELTLEENIHYFGSLYGFSNKEAIEKAFPLFKMTDLSGDDLKLPVKSLSGGMKKRFDIVLALLHNPQVLLLDEPTAGLDPLRRRDIIRIMKKICLEGVTVIISSHIMSDLEDVCHKVLVLHDGKNLIFDDIEKIKSQILDSELIKIKTLPGKYHSIVQTLRAFNILECEEKDGWLYIYTPETEILLYYILHLLTENDETLDRLIISEPDLGDVFEKIQGKSPEKVMKTHVIQLKKFICSMIGRNIPAADIKAILQTHKWPKEVAEAIVDREIKIVEREFKSKVMGK
jgi:ABC-2 type transport system ATP-binding protein